MDNKKYFETLLKEIINDGATGIISIPAVEFGNWEYHAKFYAEIDGKSNVKPNEYAPVVKIQNFAEFLPIYEEYVSLAREYYQEHKEYADYTDYGFDKLLTFTLLANCGNFDFENLTTYVQKRIDMLKKADEERKEFVAKYNGHKLFVKFEKMPPNLEAPTQFTPILQNQDGSEYVLPSVSYGFYEDKAFVASIQGEKGKQQGEAARVMDRYLRKLNSGVSLEDIEGEVSPSALASLTIFNAYLKSREINKIVSPSFMPLRSSVARSRLYKDEQKYSKEQFDEKIAKKDAEQYRATNKFIYTFPRYCSHFTESKCYFDDNTQEMKTIIKQQSKENENIIYNLDEICYQSFLEISKDI